MWGFLLFYPVFAMVSPFSAAPERPFFGKRPEFFRHFSSPFGYKKRHEIRPLFFYRMCLTRPLPLLAANSWKPRPEMPAARAEKDKARLLSSIVWGAGQPSVCAYASTPQPACTAPQRTHRIRSLAVRAARLANKRTPRHTARIPQSCGSTMVTFSGCRKRLEARLWPLQWVWHLHPPGRCQPSLRQ